MGYIVAGTTLLASLISCICLVPDDEGGVGVGYIVAGTTLLACLLLAVISFTVYIRRRVGAKETCIKEFIVYEKLLVL